MLILVRVRLRPTLRQQFILHLLSLHADLVFSLDLVGHEASCEVFRSDARLEQRIGDLRQVKRLLRRALVADPTLVAASGLVSFAEVRRVAEAVLGAR